MSVGPVATAKVLITPDLTGFQALLQAEVTKAVLAIKVPPIKAHVVATSSAAKATTVLSGSTSGAATSTAALAASTTELTGATTALTGATVKEQAAALAVTRALEAQRLAEERVTAAQLAGADAARLQALQNKAAIASQATNLSRSRLSAATSPVIPPRVGGGGLGTLANESNAARGALIGLSRATPVTIFGLGLVGTSALAAGLAIKSAIKSTADFEHQLNVLQATTDATTEQMVEITAEAKKLGADLSLPSTSAGDAAQAMTELAKAGLSVQDTLAGARGVLQLAAAAQLDVGTAATFVANELNAFGLAGEQATHIADLLAGASVAAQGDIRDFGAAFQQVSAVAHSAGVSVETTTGLLTEVAKAGLRGADAGTSYRTFLLRLTPTTKQAAQYQKALNIHLDETKTIGEQLPSLLDQYKHALEGVSPILQQQAKTQIFGQDAIRFANIAIEGGAEALDKNTRAANKNGEVAKLAAANAKGLSGAFNGLKSNSDTLGISLGNFVKGPLTAFVSGLASIVGAADKAVGALSRLKKKADEGLPKIKIPGTDTNTKDLSDKFVETAITPFKFYSVAANTIDQTVGQVFRHYRDVVRKEIEFTRLQTENIPFGITLLPITPPRDLVEPGEGATRPTNAQSQAVADAAARAKAIEDRIRAIQADAKKRKPIAADITAPRDLQINLLNAQLNDSLKQELVADQAIEAYFHKRLGRAIQGTLRYKNILAAEQQAHAATQSVLGQIASDSKQNQQAQKSALETAIANQRTRLEIAAQAAGNVGPAEQKLIAFYRKEANDIRLTEAERLGYQSALISETKSQTAGIVALAKAEIDLRNSRLDLAIQRAQLTDTPNDDRRRINNKIKALQQDIKDIQKFKHLTVQQKQEIVDLQSAITDLLLKRKSLSQTSSSGFSLNDLFAEAQKNFNQFASNVSTSVTTGGGVRGAFSAAILSQKDKLSQLEQQKLAEAAKSNDLLAQILNVLTGTVGSNPGAGSIYDPVGPANFATAAHARSFTGKT